MCDLCATGLIVEQDYAGMWLLIPTDSPSMKPSADTNSSRSKAKPLLMFN